MEQMPIEDGVVDFGPAEPQPEEVEPELEPEPAFPANPVEPQPEVVEVPATEPEPPVVFADAPAPAAEPEQVADPMASVGPQIERVSGWPGKTEDGEVPAVSCAEPPAPLEALPAPTAPVGLAASRTSILSQNLAAACVTAEELKVLGSILHHGVIDRGFLIRQFGALVTDEATKKGIAIRLVSPTDQGYHYQITEAFRETLEEIIHGA
jgi:hypothetical protein